MFKGIDGGTDHGVVAGVRQCFQRRSNERLRIRLRPKKFRCGSRSNPTESIFCTIWWASVKELVMIRTRGPNGIGCRAAILAMSIMSPRL
jgi:hypothetical protein